MVKKDYERTIPKDVLRAFIKENNLKTAEDVQHALRDIFSGTLQEMLEAEIDQNLGYTMTATSILRTGAMVIVKRRFAVNMAISFSRFPVIGTENSNR